MSDKMWMCPVCHYAVRAETPPNMCPSCKTNVSEVIENAPEDFKQLRTAVQDLLLELGIDVSALVDMSNGMSPICPGSLSGYDVHTAPRIQISAVVASRLINANAADMTAVCKVRSRYPIPPHRPIKDFSSTGGWESEGELPLLRACKNDLD